MSAIEILMPALSPTMTTGNLVRWHKGEGDQVKKGEVIAEIETDKSIVELEATDDGYLGPILVPSGAVDVPVNQRIATLASQPSMPLGGKSGTAHGSAVNSSNAPPALAASIEQSFSRPSGFHAHVDTKPDQKVRSSPLARRIAREMGIDLAAVPGSGPGGRILRADVEGARKDAQDLPTKRATRGVPSAGELHSGPSGGSQYSEVPVNNVRKTIARRLAEAKSSIPHFYLTIDCNVDPVLKWRADLNARSASLKLSVNDFIVRAVALAMHEVPAMNASWHESTIRQYADVDVAVAVATANGLITPVVRNVDKKSLAAISKEIKSLAQKARDGQLSPAEYEGGGFTVSNLGMYGIREFAAIINPPQAAILAIGASEQRVIVMQDAPAVAHMMTCTLSADHRVADGATGAEFLSAFKRLIEDPLALLIELD